MKIIFTEKELKKALEFFIQSEDGLAMKNPFDKDFESKITFRGSENQYTFIHGIEVELTEKEDGE